MTGCRAAIRIWAVAVGLGAAKPGKGSLAAAAHKHDFKISLKAKPSPAPATPRPRCTGSFETHMLVSPGSRTSRIFATRGGVLRP